MGGDHGGLVIQSEQSTYHRSLVRFRHLSQQGDRHCIRLSGVCVRNGEETHA